MSFPLLRKGEGRVRSRQIKSNYSIIFYNNSMKIKSIKEIKNLKGKRILVRVDFNVPIKNGKVVDDFRIQKTLPTLKYLRAHGAKIILLCHLGRPEGPDKKLSLRPIQKRLEKLLGESVSLLTAVETAPMLKALTSKVSAFQNGGIVMVENIRFFKEERTKDNHFAEQLSKQADIFVSDCFAVTHHPSPSISGVAKYLPSYAGLLLAAEVDGLTSVMEKPAQPLIVILSGAKADTKIPVLKNFLRIADYILISGGVFNTYLAAKGFKVGRTMVQKEFYKEVLRYCSNKKVIKPIDFVVGDQNGKHATVVPFDKKFGIKNKELGIYDVGPRTVQLFSSYVKKAQTLIWNGPVGMFEVHPYEYGTYALAHLFAARSKGKAFGVVGGGETVQVFEKLKLSADVDLVSTGGGATLEFLSGKKLPGVEALLDKGSLVAGKLKLMPSG